MIREAIAHIVAGATLSEDEAAAVMEEIMSGVATQAQMGAFLTALRLRPGGKLCRLLGGQRRPPAPHPNPAFVFVAAQV